jgi:hypothetical protein
MSNQTTIKCPNCQTDIDVNKIIYQQLEDKLKRATAKQLKLEKQRIQEELKQEILEEQKELMVLLERELEEKSNQVKELNRSRAKIARLEREKEEAESKAKVEAELALSEELQRERAKIAKELIAYSVCKVCKLIRRYFLMFSSKKNNLFSYFHSLNLSEI